MFKEGDLVEVDTNNILDKLLASLGQKVLGMIVSVDQEKKTAKIWGQYDFEMMSTKTQEFSFKKLSLVGKK